MNNKTARWVFLPSAHNAAQVGARGYRTAASTLPAAARALFLFITTWWGSDMSIRLIIPDAVPAADRRAVLERIRRDKQQLFEDMDDALSRNVISMPGVKYAAERIRSLAALEKAWAAVQMDDVA